MEFLYSLFVPSRKSNGDESGLNNIIIPVSFKKSINVKLLLRLIQWLWDVYRVDLKNRQKRCVNWSHKFSVSLALEFWYMSLSFSFYSFLIAGSLLEDKQNINDSYSAWIVPTHTTLFPIQITYFYCSKLLSL